MEVVGCIDYWCVCWVGGDGVDFVVDVGWIWVLGGVGCNG